VGFSDYVAVRAATERQVERVTMLGETERYTRQDAGDEVDSLS
jgi:hypothetical protein